MKISELPLLTSPADGDYVPADRGSGPQTGRYTLNTLLTKYFGPMLYPVGSLYFSTSSTNPATALGFGTWTAYAAGRFVVGVGTSDQTFAAGATGGESNHTLTTNEMPSHSHNPQFSNGNASVVGAGSGTAANIPGGGANFVSKTENATTNTGGGAAHNNLPPYVAAYIWQRTA